MTSYRDFCVEANLMAWRFARDNAVALALWVMALVAGFVGLAQLGAAALAGGFALFLLWTALLTAALAEHRRSGRRLARLPFAGLGDAVIRRFALRATSWTIVALAVAVLPVLIAWESPGDGYAGVVTAGLLGVFLGGSLLLRMAMAMLGWLHPVPLGTLDALTASWGRFVRLGGRLGAVWLPSALGLFLLAALQGKGAQALSAAPQAAGLLFGIASSLPIFALLVFMLLAVIGWAVRCNEVLGFWGSAAIPASPSRSAR